MRTTWRAWGALGIALGPSVVGCGDIIARAVDLPPPVDLSPPADAGTPADEGKVEPVDAHIHDSAPSPVKDAAATDAEIVCAPTAADGTVITWGTTCGELMTDNAFGSYAFDSGGKGFALQYVTTGGDAEILVGNMDAGSSMGQSGYTHTFAPGTYAIGVFSLTMTVPQTYLITITQSP